MRPNLLKASNLPSDVIKGCLLASGAYDFRDPGIYGLPLKNPLLDAYLKNPDDAADASPITWVEGNTVPFLVTWGENDRDDARYTAPAFLAALRQQTGRAEAHKVPKMDHTWMHLAQQSATSAWRKTAIAWLHGDPHTAPGL